MFTCIWLNKDLDALYTRACRTIALTTGTTGASTWPGYADIAAGQQYTQCYNYEIRQRNETSFVFARCMKHSHSSSSITRRGDPSAFRRREETPPFFLPVRLKPSGQWSTFCNWH